MKKFVITVAALVSVLGVAAAAGQAAAVPPVCTVKACGGW
ncbi:ABC-type glycerol-3-phosphate transport system substrate-binding protein [Asticcacaulis solisilvae]|nr:ABC-type glycerol-3-phosphate transport system substrate-binding protein [Asticcacaulis solisilvae]MDR6799855.1 ABC-type glycerol-3-phosphate transport system substrate-binding protein [Asticcacaulis sp. BE141]